MIPIKDMEEAIILVLKEVPGLKKVDSYRGSIEDAMRETVTHPAALVLYGGALPKDMVATRDSASGKVIISFTLWVIGRNLRGQKEASADVRDLLDLCREKLNGMKVSALERTLLWQSEALEFTANTGVCAYEQQYTYADFV